VRLIHYQETRLNALPSKFEAEPLEALGRNVE
jgi:hypothetical protein